MKIFLKNKFRKKMAENFAIREVLCIFAKNIAEYANQK